MKTIKIIILFAVIFFVNSVFSQKANNRFWEGFSVKAGINCFSFSNKDYGYNNIFDNANFKASIVFDYSKKMTFELEYIYMPDYFFGRGGYHITTLDENGELLEHDTYGNSDRIYSNVFNARVNYNVLNLLEVFPVYLIGSASTSIQSVKNEDYRYNIKKIEPHFYSEYQNTTILNSYMRFLIGPKVGVGLNYMFGRFGINVESSVSLRYSPFIDKGYKEVDYNLGFASIYKF